MAGVLVQGSGHLESCAPRCAALEAACLSVLRLLRTCILQHANLAEAIRSSRSNLIIASLDSLLLDRLSAASEATGIAAIATFIMQVSVPRNLFSSSLIIVFRLLQTPYLIILY